MPFEQEPNEQQQEYEIRTKAIYKRFLEDCRNYAFYEVKDLWEAGDIVTEVFANITEDPKKCLALDEAGILPYLRTCIHNEIIDRYKERKKQKEKDRELEYVKREDRQLNVEDTIDRSERLKHFYQLVAKLPERRREVISLILEGYDTKQIAALLHITEQTVRNTKQDAFEDLRKSARKKGWYPWILFALLP